MISARDDITRAAFDAAYALKGTPGFAAAVERIIFVHNTWPLIRYHDAIIAAERDIEARLDLLDREPWRTWELFPDIDVCALAAACSVLAVAA